MNFNTDVTGDLIFLEKDIKISDKIIGRGAFGEVRVAKWRNIDVAAKRLHSLVLDKETAQIEGSTEVDSNYCSVVDSFRAEMETLAKLRHPNLVLFLGIACNARTRQPTTILTELMPGSLYDILEVHKVHLTLPEILDIAIDVCSGLEYLHNHNPQIVHRDISSKNILIGGNQAKIADLGQAKIFSSALSRQTGMPGAMAYSAPEVLTGRYTAKIDIFSFGILLIQMSTGDYPRIDRREDQLKTASQKYSPLQAFLSECVAFQPDERPTSEALCEGLKDLRNNDRYYPPIRRQSPQCDIGVMARRYQEESVEQRCGDVRLALEQTARRLTIEERRWREEAARVDALQKMADDYAAQLTACQDALSRQKSENGDLQNKLDESNCRIYELSNETAALKADKADLVAQLRSLQSDHEALKQKVNDLQQNLVETAHKTETTEERVNAAKDETAFALQREKNLIRQKEMQAEEIKELEERLEQALMRWRQEKALVVSEGERCARLRDNCADMLERANKNTAEIERLTRRLHLYDSLPMPEEIKARFRDYEEDAKRSKDDIEELTKQRRDLKDKLKQAEQLCVSTQASLDNAESERSRLELEGNEKSCKINELSEALTALGQRFESSTTLVSILEGDKQNLIDISDKLRKQVSEKEDELAAMRAARRKERKNMGGGRSKTESVEDASVRSKLTEDSDNEYDNDDLFEEADENADDREPEGKEDNPADTKKPTQKESSLPKFSNDSMTGIMAVVRAAAITRENSTILAENASLNSKNDLLERKRKMDADAKLRIQQATEHGGAVNVIKVVYENMHCENTCWRGARAIRDLIIKDDNIKMLCLEAKGDELMLAGLMAFPNSAITQAQCLRGLATFCFGNDLVRRHCGESGSLKRIVIALETHSDDPSVVHHACTALTNLTHNNVDNRMRFQEAGGIEALVYAIGQHWKDSAKITRQGFWAILTLAGTDDLSIEIVECGGAKIITEAMVHHSHDAGVQQFGSWAISNLALANEEVRMKIRKLGIIEICRIALETHADDLEVVRQCRHALGLLGPDSDGSIKSGMGSSIRAHSSRRPNTPGNATTPKRSKFRRSPQDKIKKTPGKR